MTMPDDERELRQQHERVRLRDEQEAPPFAAMWQSAAAGAALRRKRSSGPWIVLSLATAAAGATAILLLSVTAPRGRKSESAAAVDLQAPSLEFLMDAPGRALMSQAPDFDSNPLAGLTRSMPAGFE